MNFKTFFAKSILTEDYNPKNYNGMQAKHIIPHFVKKFGYSSPEEFMNSDMKTFMTILKAFNSVAGELSGVDANKRPNSDDEDGPWSENHPNYDKFVTIIIRDMEKMIKEPVAAQSQV